MAKQKLIGEELVKAGLITPKQLEFALEEQKKMAGGKKERIGEILIRSGIVDAKVLIAFLEKYLGIPYANLNKPGSIDNEVVKFVPESVARQFNVVPMRVNKENNKLCLAMNNPLDFVALDAIKFKSGHDIERYFAQTSEIDNSISKLYKSSARPSEPAQSVPVSSFESMDKSMAQPKTSADTQYKTLKMDASRTSVVEIVNRVLTDAVQEGASDIHVEPHEGELRIRYRVDGLLRDTVAFPKAMKGAITTRLKLLGGMDIAEHRLPQDGRFKFMHKSTPIDLRMSSTPITTGEKLVLRILDSSSLLLKFEDLGLVHDSLRLIKDVLRQAYGLMLVTGPTGSGKTTTLYTSLNFINSPEKNIVTIEDPVEYQIEGINQIQTKHSIGLTFATGLRSVLRQDPDVIMIGEIRDLETLENAVKASLTGHMVLSTIHTNNAPSVIPRLMHMGLEPYLISSCLSLIIAQRLCRKICENCKDKLELPPQTIEGLEKRSGISMKGVTFYRGKGCSVCKGSGYKGRTGIYEILNVTPRVRKLILEQASEVTIRKVAMEEGMKDMFRAGIEKVHEGQTSIEEVLRVTVLEKGNEA